MKSFTETVHEVDIRAALLLNPVHEDAHIRELANAFRARLESIGARKVYLVRSSEDVKRFVEESRRADGIVLVFVSGGTSRTAITVYEELRKPPLMLGHEYHNASASMMSAQSRIRFELGGRVAGWYTVTPDSPLVPLLVAAYRTAISLSKLHVVQIDADELSRDAVVFQEKVGGKVTLVSKEETAKLLTESSRGVEAYVSELKDIDTGGASVDGIKKSLTVYVLATRLLDQFNANAFTVDCFPFITRYKVTPCLAISRLLDLGFVAACEADYRALTLLAVSLGVTGLPGWIGNYNALARGGRVLKMSHCTVATRLTRYATFLPHFETGNPYAVAGPLKESSYTIAAISPDYTMLWYVEAKLVESGTISGGKCRTQASFEVAWQLDEADIVSNHHVAIPGSVAPALSVIARYLGMKLVRGGAS
jgi:L-fucose isomerase-like protein